MIDELIKGFVINFGLSILNVNAQLIRLLALLSK